jgi:hypothetical protein
MSLRLFLLCYNDRSEHVARHEYPEYEAWSRVVRLNRHYLMENSIFYDPEHESQFPEEGYVGFLSWRAREKLRHLPSLRFVTEKILLNPSSAPDVLYFSSASVGPGRSVVESACASHPRFLELWIALITSLGYAPQNAIRRDIPFMAFNYWIATAAWARRYRNCLRRAVQILSSWGPRSYLGRLLHSDSTYNGRLTREERIELFGAPHYKYHPFLLERLPGFFFFMEGASVVGLGDTTTIFQRYVPEFHAASYLSRYADLRQHGIHQHAAAARHFIQFGYDEGRDCKKE